MRESNDIISSNLAQNLRGGLMQNLFGSIMFMIEPLGLGILYIVSTMLR